MLRVFPRINELYSPFIKALKAGNVQAYDAALEWAEPRLVDMGVFLAVEKAREVCMRGFFRKVYVCHSSPTRPCTLTLPSQNRWHILGEPTRITIAQFHDAFRVSGLTMPMEETECFLANMIFKGYIKGYISHGLQTVVLAKGAAAFPKLSERNV